jgi:hypothetical protein
MVASGFSVRLSVFPGWPFCPPGFLPDRSRRLLTRTDFFVRPSLDGGFAAVGTVQSELAFQLGDTHTLCRYHRPQFGVLRL